MKTKLVYIIALLTLAMSSFAIAEDSFKKLKYQTSSPVSGRADARSKLCEFAKNQMDRIPSSKSCKGKGEFGQPVGIEKDSDCVCQTPTGNPSTGTIECTFGVHWYCSYDRDAK